MGMIYFARLRKKDVIILGTTGMGPLLLLDELEAEFGPIREVTWLDDDEPHWRALDQRFNFYQRFRHLRCIDEYEASRTPPGRRRIHGGMWRADPELLEFLATLDPATSIHGTAAAASAEYRARWQAAFERHRSFVEGTGVVYFARFENGAIKIGVTEHLDSRLPALECFYRGRLEVLGTIPGDRQTERQLHKRFAHLRLGQPEQFRPTRELMEFLGRLLGRKLRAHPDPQAIEVWDPARDERKRKKLERILQELERRRQERLYAAVVELCEEWPTERNPAAGA
jgi:hypothetical protein